MSRGHTSIVSPTRTDYVRNPKSKVPPFRPRQRRRLEAYVRTVADLMGLRDWTIEISWSEPTAPDEDASIAPVFGRRLATLCLSDAFRAATPDYRRYLIVHELLHCHLAHVDSYVERSNKKLLSRDQRRAVNIGYEQASETAVDTIAASWAELLPLPDLA